MARRRSGVGQESARSSGGGKESSRRVGFQDARSSGGKESRRQGVQEAARRRLNIILRVASNIYMGCVDEESGG